MRQMQLSQSWFCILIFNALFLCEIFICITQNMKKNMQQQSKFDNIYVRCVMISDQRWFSFDL